MIHGSIEIEASEALPVWLGSDPALALVYADMGAWLDAHPCSCEALCTCEDADA